MSSDGVRILAEEKEHERIGRRQGDRTVGEVVLTKRIPIPKDQTRVKKYPFAQMEVGESFAAPFKKQRKLLNSAQYYKREHGKEFTVRKRIENGIHVVRVWRIK